ncbi:MAG: hypothetical protein ACRDP6_15605 [Actinoallomurus sp.]
MSGHDDTFLPPDGEDAKLAPYPPTPAPPHFGQGPAEEPSQTADTRPGHHVFSGSSVASDVEETMTPPPPQRPGDPAPDAQNPATAPYGTSYDMTGAPSQNDPYGTTPPVGRHAAPPEAGHRPIGFPPPPVGQPASGPPSPSPSPSPSMDADAERTTAYGTGSRDDAYGTFTPGAPPYGSPGPADPIPEAERTVTDEVRPPTGTPGTSPYGSAPPYKAAGANGFAEPNGERVATEEPTPARAPSPGMPLPEDGQTVDLANGQITMAVARYGTDPTSATPGPALTPDAILPPGTPPQAPPEPPPPDPSVTATGPIPRLGAGAGFPGGPGTQARDGAGGSSAAHRALLVAGGLVAALVLGGGGALAVTTLSGSSHKDHNVAQVPPPAPTSARPTPTPSRTKAKHKPKHVPIDIRDEKTDPKPLSISEIFPSRKLKLAGHTFIVAKTVINDHCSLAANGPFAQELTREHCRRVVRATFVSDDKKIAVTTGIAVMPTDAAARATLKVQDPSHYEWFRGMKATGAPKIDQPGGYAASTMRGRYISYAYVAYVDGHKPSAKDNTLKTVGGAFRDSTMRPIARRAKH